MAKDRRRAVLAGLVALPFLAAAGSAGASDALPLVATVGVGIDHTMHAYRGSAEGLVGAVDAVGQLSRSIAQPMPTRYSPPGGVPQAIGGLRGLPVGRAIDTAGLVLSSDLSSAELTASRPDNRPMPYVRFSETERVFGLSFKIQPPPAAPEAP
jgi:hypothetical protein